MTHLRGEFAVSPFGQLVGGGAPLVSAGELPELTPEELRNGWTREKLAAYRQERDRAAFGKIFMPVKRLPRKTARGFEPLKW